MPDFLSPLPARPSLEQLQKLAKELLRQYRAGDHAAAERFRAVTPRLADPARARQMTLADAQFVLAREHGFESWAQLKHRIEAMQPAGLEKYERLAKDLAAAYATGNAMAIREINWHYGTSFVWDRTVNATLAHAQAMVAHSYGFAGWASFAESVARPPEIPRSSPHCIGAAPPFYRIDWKRNTISVRGPMSPKDWDTIAGVMREHQINGLTAGGITDAALELLCRIDHLARLNFDGSMQLTDAGLAHLAQLPRLEDLNISGVKGRVTDRGLEVLRHLPELRRFQMCWQPNVSDAGAANLAFCKHLESVNLLGTPTGDGAIRALTGKRSLRRFKTGRSVTDRGLALLHQFPVFHSWQGGDIRYELMSADAGPNHLLVDGPFTNAGLASLAGLDGLFALTFFWHCPAFTGKGLEALARLPNLGFLGCQNDRCDDEAMRHIAAMPRLRMLMGQGAVASDAGFAALSRSKTIEYIWGRDCPNLTGRGFTALRQCRRSAVWR